MTDHPYAPLLDRVHNPSQYVGNEVHSVVKDRAVARCRVALCFPELYGIGMSHLGLKILYSIVNKSPGLWAERFFAPEPDMEALLRRENIRLASLESHDPLSAFDIVGFSVSTELCFTGILTMLDLGGVPLKRVERGEGHPLVIGGGASVFNPEPVADFFDLFVLGDAEEVLPQLAYRYADLKKAGMPKEGILRELAKIEGVCVPSFFTVEYDGPKLKSLTPVHADVQTPRRAILPDLGKSPFPFDMVIPYGQPVFDRLSVEIDRGCTGGCRYCQAGMTYRPVRERSADEVAAIIRRGVRETGFDDVTLASLSSGDYSSIEQLVTMVMDEAEEDAVSVSLPSLRSGTLTEDLIRQVARVRKTGFTITAEAGTERLRRVINKKMTDEEIIGTARKVLAGGWRILKLYFMIGLPTETDEDVEGIVRLVGEINALNEGGRRFQSVNVGVSQFVPKAHTPFQWVAMDSPDELWRKKSILTAGFRRMKSVKLKGHDTDMSYLEGVFSRGDRRLAEAVLIAYQKGCRLDGWTEHFRFDLWMEAFKESGLNPDDLALRQREADEILPWDYMNIGVTKKFLLRELKDAEKEVESPDCRFGKCQGCGLPADDNVINPPHPPVAAKEHISLEPAQPSVRYRVHFRKEGMARHLSHLETMAAFTRAIRRATLPMAYSRGFHPHAKLSFGPALSVGVISHAEALDIETVVPVETGEIAQKLNAQMERGLTVHSVTRLNPPIISIQAGAKATVWAIADTVANEPPLSAVRAALEGMEGISSLEREGNVLWFESAREGVLTKLRAALPGFALTHTRSLTKLAVK